MVVGVLLFNFAQEIIQPFTLPAILIEYLFGIHVLLRLIFASSQAPAWEFGLEALASRFAKLRLAWMQEVEQRRSIRGSQSGDWEPAHVNFS